MPTVEPVEASPDAASFEVEFGEIDEAIRELERKKAPLLQKAFDEGGAEQAVRLVNEIESMKDARFELLRAALDRNATGYAQLAADANKAAKALRAEVKRLRSIAKVLDGIADTLNLLGRLIIRFAL